MPKPKPGTKAFGELARKRKKRISTAGPLYPTTAGTTRGPKAKVVERAARVAKRGVEAVGKSYVSGVKRGAKAAGQAAKLMAKKADRKGKSPAAKALEMKNNRMKETLRDRRGQEEELAPGLRRHKPYIRRKK